MSGDRGGWSASPSWRQGEYNVRRDGKQTPYAIRTCANPTTIKRWQIMHEALGYVGLPSRTIADCLDILSQYHDVWVSRGHI